MDEHIITAVSKYPGLYDTNEAGYKDNLRKENIWQVIADELSISGIYY